VASERASKGPPAAAGASRNGHGRARVIPDAPGDLGAGEGPFEQAGLGVKLTQTNEEKVEVNSVV
jgi:hypothetical protein